MSDKIKVNKNNLVIFTNIINKLTKEEIQHLYDKDERIRKAERQKAEKEIIEWQTVAYNTEDELHELKQEHKAILEKIDDILQKMCKSGEICFTWDDRKKFIEKLKGDTNIRKKE